MKTNNKIRNNANDLYNIYLQRERLIELNENIFITEGMSDVIEYEDCLNIIELILNQQKFIFCEFQSWQIVRDNEDLFNIYCLDSNNNVKMNISNIRLEFYFDDFNFIIKDGVICLPCELEIYFKT